MLMKQREITTPLQRMLLGKPIRDLIEDSLDAAGFNCECFADARTPHVHGTTPDGRDFAAAVVVCKSSTHCHFGDHEILGDHRRQIIGTGQVGGVAGVIVVAVHQDIDVAFWLPWPRLRDYKSLPIDDWSIVTLGAMDSVLSMREIL